jgi:hypothetical protein
VSASVCHSTGDELTHLPQLLSRTAQHCVQEKAVQDNVKNVPDYKREIKIRYLEYENFKKEITGEKK